MATKRKQQILRIFRKSCITNKIMWIGHERSRATAKKAYMRTVRREKERMRNWTKMIDERKSNILHILNDCLAGMSITDQLSPEKRVFANQLVAMTETDVTYSSALYEHIMHQSKR